MKYLNTISSTAIQKQTNISKGSVKIGETIQQVTIPDNWQQELQESNAKFVIVGLPEEIGIKSSQLNIANQGTFSSFTKQFLNLQDNLYMSGEDIFLLGTIFFEDLANKLKVVKVSHNELHHIIEEIDNRVEQLITTLFEMNKMPIIIGGGQNNSFPIIKALSKTLNTQVNVLNVAAHTSLKPPTGRTARNSYSYGIVEGFIHKFYAFGLHESEIPHSIYEFILANYDHIGFTRFEAILKNDPYLFEALTEAKMFLEGQPTGFDINMNCISDIILSPQNPDGFLLREVRQLIKKFCDNNENVKYLHLCEASINHQEYQTQIITGKTLALLVSDFIKAYLDN